MSEELTETGLHGIDVLVVDDEPMVRDFVCRVLVRNGHTCRTAADAGEALAVVDERAPTLVITDVRMPGKDGTWLLTELKKRRPEMPVIMLTAVSEAKQAVECLKAGAHDYLVKPIDVDELLIAVARGAERMHLILEGQRHRRELEETVRSRTARLRGALQTIEASYQDTLGALVNAQVAEDKGALLRPASSSLEPSVSSVEQTVELEALRSAGKLIAEGATHLVVGNAIASELVEKGKLLCARLWVKQRNAQGLEAAVNMGGGTVPGVSFAREALSSGKTRWEENGGVTSVVSPIIVRGVAEGVLQLGWREDKRDDMVPFTERLALVLAASLARELETRERHRAGEELELFQKLASASRYSLDLEHVATFLMKSLHRIVDYDVAGLLLLEDEPSLSIRARFPLDREFVERVRSQIGNTLKLTCGVEPPADLDLRLIDGERDQHRGERPHKLRSFVNVPLSVGGSVVGLIHVSSGKDQAFSDEEILFVHRAADFLASSVQGVRELLATVKGRIEQMVDHMSDGVLMLDGRGRVVAMNGAARRVLGTASEDETADISMLTRLLDGDPVAMMRRERRSLRKLVCVSGVPYQAQLSPVVGENDELVGAVLAFRDFEQEKRVDEMKTELVNVVSHELRTPLTAIRNALFLLRGPKLGSLTPEQDRFAELAKRNAEQLGEIINDLLDLSKIEAGKMHLDLETTSIADPVTSALATLTPQADAKGVELSSSIASDLPKIYGHAPSLRRVIVNLLGNALKFTERGGRVSVEVAASDGAPIGSSRGAVRVTVVDSGVGIPPEQLESVFEKFHQVDSPMKAATPGTGLGLSICRELVHAHHGRIWAESDAGKGSRFSFVVPVLSERELLLRSLDTELHRAQGQDGALSLVLARIANPEEILRRSDDDGLRRTKSEFLAASRRAVRRSSDRVLWNEEAGEVAIILPRTTSDGGRAFESRLLEEIQETGLKAEGLLLTVSTVEYPKDGKSAEELYGLASERVHEPTAA